MKILAINSYSFGSTGNVMNGISDVARKKGHEVEVCFPQSRSNCKYVLEKSILIGNSFTRNIHLKLGYITGRKGCFSIISTINFLRKVNKFNPDVIHLHNLHDGYINLPILFQFLKKKNIPVVWTLHDCWAFTGQCAHYSLDGCYKWKKECNNCSHYDVYPRTKFDNSRTMFLMKKGWFTNIPNLTLVTPSCWLKLQVKESFLKEYPVQVIYNGIDLDVFRPTQSDFREKNNIPQNDYLLLGVAFGWGKRKGLDVFIELAEKLPSHYRIVLVGTDEKVDEELPYNIISIHRTQNKQELAEIYTAADLFINPTREEVLGLVNIEANACGTPVITFKSGGSPECISEKSGVVVECDDIDSMKKEIIKICTEKSFTELDCINRAKTFDKNKRFEEYIQLYEQVYS